MRGPAVAAALERRLLSVVVLANLVGATVVFLFLTNVLPTVASVDDEGLESRNGVVFAVYLVTACLVGWAVGRRRSSAVVAWLRSGGPAGATERTASLRVPATLARTSAVLWSAAAVLFTALNALVSPVLALQVALTVALGGLTTSALVALLVERAMRPVVALAHAEAGDPPRLSLGVSRRMVLAWVVGSGVPLFGIGLGAVQLADEPPLGTTGTLFLVGIGLLVGLLATVAAARAVADPVQEVAAALRRVGTGDLAGRVPVYDASEVGQLQAGFNAMAEGLRERERLRDLFGRQVGADVARLALEQGVRLGGERRDVAVLYVDVVGSTALAVELEPEEVVRRLNGFFAVVVEAVGDHGGWVNKFEGDAALCVFGAPAALDDARACALAAARAMVRGLRPLDLDAALGVGGGEVVAGHVGTESRFEYTVVGDPVNTAARLAELAKERPGRVLADAALLDGAGDEARQWTGAGEVVLRGRDRPTGLAEPGGAA